MIQDNKSRGRTGFTLVEMLVAMAVTALLIILLTNTVSSVATSWKNADAKVTSFQASRFAFERIGRSLSQATLNPYWDYLDAGSNRRTTNNAGSFVPASYARCSDQHFLIGPATSYASAGQGWACFAQAPLGYSTNTITSKLDNLLNAVGFFVEYNNDADAGTRSLKPDFITGSKQRFRLMELLQPTESLGVYTSTNDGWITSAMGTSRQARPLADNVITLIFQAKDSDGSNLPAGALTYAYDSRDQSSSGTWNQLPTQVQVTMVAIDEPSAARMSPQNKTALQTKLGGLFIDPSKFDADLKRDATSYPDTAADPSLEAYLINNRFNYRIFNTTVRIESAKWSK